LGEAVLHPADKPEECRDVHEEEEEEAIASLDRTSDAAIRGEKEGHASHLMQSDLHNKLSVGASDQIDHCVCVCVCVYQSMHSSNTQKPPRLKPPALKRLGTARI